MKALVACATGIVLMALAASRRPAAVDDFRAFYRAASLLAAHESVYSHPAEAPEGTSNQGFLPFLRLPSYAAMLRPIAALPYPAARPLWLLLNFLALAGCVWLNPFRRDGLAVAFSWSLPVAFSFVLGQDIALVLFLVLAAIRLASLRKEVAAGVVLSLLAIKITYLPVIGIVLLRKSRRGTLAIALGLALQLALSFAVAGQGWIAEYLAVIRNPLLDLEPRRMLNFRAIIASLSLPEWLILIATLAILVWLVVAVKRLSLSDSLLLALPLGLITSPHSYVYDGVVLIPLFVAVAEMHSWWGLTALLCLTPLPYLSLISPWPALVLMGSGTIVLATLFCAVRFSKLRTVNAEIGSPPPIQAAVSASA